MALGATTIATGIAALTITGVTVKDLTAIPDVVYERDCPILYPDHANWLTGSTGSNEGESMQTFGAAGAGMWVIERVMRYQYFHTVVGAGRGLKDFYSAMSTKQDAIITALLALDLTNCDVMRVECSEFGSFADASNNSLLGFTVLVTVKERVNQ